MARFDRGVSYYTSGVARIEVYFPEDEVCCRYCRFCREDGVGRCWCRLNGEMLYNIDFLGRACPIELERSGGDG